MDAPFWLVGTLVIGLVSALGLTAAVVVRRHEIQEGEWEIWQQMTARWRVNENGMVAHYTSAVETPDQGLRMITLCSITVDGPWRIVPGSRHCGVCEAILAERTLVEE